MRPFRPSVPWPALSNTPHRGANLPTSGPRPFLWIFSPISEGFWAGFDIAGKPHNP